MHPKMTFLLVEDDLNDAYLLQRELRKSSERIVVHHVWNGGDAILYMQGEDSYHDRKKHPLPNVILLDLKMPGINGFEFLEWLRTKSKGDLHLIPVIVISSSTIPDDIKRAYALGANSFMSKPVAWEEFQERIRALGIYWGTHVETTEILRTIKSHPTEGKS